VSKITALLRNQHKVPLKAIGDSMLPVLHSGDLVYYSAVPFLKLQINDLVVCKHAKIILIHRVIYRTAKYLLTKGDNNLNCDERVFARQVIGRVTRVKRAQQFFTPESLYLIQSAHYLAEIEQINSAFAANKLNFLFLKGLLLHLHYEKLVPRRLYADCDVLIDPEQLKSAIAILKKQGYSRAPKHLSAWQAKFKNYDPELVFCKKLKSGFLVSFDLHQELVFQMTELGRIENFYSMSMLADFTQAALRTKRAVKLDGISYPMLAPDFLIIYLLLHLFHHNYQGAFRYQILKIVLTQEVAKAAFSWLRLSELIISYRLESFVYPAIVLLQRHYQCKFPSQFLNFLRPKTWLLRVITNNILKQVNHLTSQSRIKEGVRRFGYLFMLSPQSGWQRILVFVQPAVLASVFWVISRKVVSVVQDLLKFPYAKKTKYHPGGDTGLQEKQNP